MVRINDEMKYMFENLNEPASIATVDDDGRPNVVCKGSMGVLDDENLWYAEVAGSKTFENLKKNPQVAVVITSQRDLDGYQFKGTAELIEEGPLYERAAQYIEKVSERIKFEIPPPRAAVKIKVDEIYSLNVKQVVK
jgi:uncharacterized protein